MLFASYPNTIKLTCVIPLFLILGCVEDKTVTKEPTTEQAKTAIPNRTQPVSNNSTKEIQQVKQGPTVVRKEATITDIKQETDPEKNRTLQTEQPEKDFKKPKPKPIAKPNLKFDLIRHNFDTIQAGDIIDYKFEFTNTGNAPLVINSARATCGCTQPSYPFVPIEPVSYTHLTLPTKA